MPKSAHSALIFLEMGKFMGNAFKMGYIICARFSVTLSLSVAFSSRESEGSFQFGNYWDEVDDLHAVAQHFRESNRVISAIVGHSKGTLTCSPYV